MAAKPEMLAFDSVDDTLANMRAINDVRYQLVEGVDASKSVPGIAPPVLACMAATSSSIAPGASACTYALALLP
jgi:hypothetical protein